MPKSQITSPLDQQQPPKATTTVSENSSSSRSIAVPEEIKHNKIKQPGAEDASPVMNWVVEYIEDSFQITQAIPPSIVLSKQDIDNQQKSLNASAVMPEDPARRVNYSSFVAEQLDQSRIQSNNNNQSEISSISEARTTSKRDITQNLLATINHSVSSNEKECGKQDKIQKPKPISLQSNIFNIALGEILEPKTVSKAFVKRQNTSQSSERKKFRIQTAQKNLNKTLCPNYNKEQKLLAEISDIKANLEILKKKKETIQSKPDIELGDLAHTEDLLKYCQKISRKFPQAQEVASLASKKKYLWRSKFMQDVSVEAKPYATISAMSTVYPQRSQSKATQKSEAVPKQEQKEQPKKQQQQSEHSEQTISEKELGYMQFQGQANNREPDGYCVNEQEISFSKNIYSNTAAPFTNKPDHSLEYERLMKTISLSRQHMEQEEQEEGETALINVRLVLRNVIFPTLPQRPVHTLRLPDILKIGREIFKLFKIMPPDRPVTVERYNNCIHFQTANCHALWYDTGRIYIGEYQVTNKNKHEGQKQGFGVEHVPKRYMYEGEYKNNKKSGAGKLFLQNGDIYEGQFYEGLKHGKGKLRERASGNILDGEWKQDKMDGFGKVTYRNGDIFEGFFERGNQTYGYKKFSNGDVYRGQFVAGKMHGKGQYTWNNGEIYNGQFQNGSRSGKGMWQSSATGPQEVYVGDYLNDKKHGHGKYTWASGAVYEGQFENDQRHGLGIVTMDTQVTKGQWENGKLVKNLEMPTPFELVKDLRQYYDVSKPRIIINTRKTLSSSGSKTDTKMKKNIEDGRPESSKTRPISRSSLSRGSRRISVQLPETEERRVQVVRPMYKVN